jgi:OOP family OmpA-OmpF porin
MSSLSTQPPPEYPEEEIADGPYPDIGLGGDANLDQLRWLLLAPEQRQIRALRHRLDDPRQKSEELSACLAEAVAIRSERDCKLQAALQPIVQDALRVAAARDPKSLAATLTPILVPALFRAGARALRRRLASLNNTLGRLLSFEGLRWRIISWRTGDPVNAVALTSSHRYRVEHAFLIHRESGRLLGDAGFDVERNTGLIAAIESLGGDPIGDAFRERAPDKPKSLDILEIGERKLWLRHGPLATLAVVVAGFPHAALGQQLEVETEVIHEVFGDALRDFDGDAAGIPGVAKHLRGCLMLGRRKIGAGDPYKTLWSLATLILIVAGYLAAGRLREGRDWEHYVDQVRGQSGIVVIDAQQHWASYSIRGLRDPLATDPQTLLPASGVPAARVSEQWEPYLSLDPRIAAKRTQVAEEHSAEKVSEEGPKAK